MNVLRYQHYTFAQKQYLIAHPVESFLQKLQQHLDGVHVDANVLDRALLDFRHQQDIKTRKRQVPQKVHRVAVTQIHIKFGFLLQTD